jgi:hypothetical protein
MSRWTRTLVAAVTAAAAVAAAPVTNAQTRVNADAALAAEFIKKTQAYSALHNKLEAGLPKLGKEATPEEIESHQRAMERLLAQGRPRAQVGEFFTKEIRAYFRRQLTRVFQGPEGKPLRASIMDENPGPIKLQINGRYPDNVPLATMPPQVLSALPRLPEDLEYRFIGSRLVLLDVHANVVVDYIEDAMPT